MQYPENLKIGDTIGICAPSEGIADPEKQKRLDCAKAQLMQMGYSVIETESVRKNQKGRSATPKQRAKEFMELLEDEKVKLIIFATGGDFACEILDELNWEKLKKIKPKWIQGYSDITTISFLWNTILDIPTLYAQSIKDYAMKPLHKSLQDALAIASGNPIVQNAFDYYEKEWLNEDNNPYATYHLTEKVNWKNITGEDKIVMQGRAIGGCLDCIQTMFATKYDYIKDYIQKYKQDGILWFLESFETGTANLYRTLWQMKNAGYFAYCKGIILGRPLFVHEDYAISYNETVKAILGDLKIPIICDADIGHVSPQMAMVSGAILRITSQGGKGKVETFLK